MEDAIPLQVFKTNEISPVPNKPVNTAGESVLIDLEPENGEKSKAKESADSGLGQGPDSLNNTMIFRGNTDPSASLVTSSLRPSAPSPSFNTTPTFSSTLNPFLSVDKIARSPDGSDDFQGYRTLQVSI